MNQTRHRIAGPALPVLLLLLVAQAACRPSTESESDIASLPQDVDNVEIHHVKVVDGVMYEDHPVIMYKEDFVNEDYDPSKNETKVNHRKLYRNLQRIRHHHKKPAVEPETVEEKILFDVLPETPIIMGDDESGTGNFEVAQLVQPSKEESLQKYPKKYHSRHRRQAYNPYARRTYLNYGNYIPEQPTYYTQAPYYLPSVPQQSAQRYPAAGKKPKLRGKLPIWQNQKPHFVPMSIDDRFGIDNRDGFQPDENSLFHNSNPDNADFSVFDKPRPRPTSRPSNNVNNWQSPPLEEPERAPVWGPSEVRRPNNENTARNGAAAPSIQAAAPWARPPQAPPRPALRQDTVRYPQEPSYPTGTACHRASELCCSLGDLGSLYECFSHQNCAQSLSEILSACS